MDSPFTLRTPEAVERVRRHEAPLHVYVNRRLDEALEDARRLAAEPPRSALHGVPFGLKDEFETAALPTTGGSWRFRHRRSPGDGAAAACFLRAGAVLLGKTNLSDLGVAPEASSWVGGSTLNPFDRARTSGGSSGGSAAAVAYGFEGFDWGTDIGGSIRLPAAFCGVLGLRLSHATWPIADLFPRVPPSMDWLCGQGPFARTVAQLRAVLAVAAPALRTGQPAFSLRGAVLHPPDAGRWPTFEADLRPALRECLGAEAPRAPLPAPSALRTTYAAMWASHLEDLLQSDPTLTLGSALGAVASALLLRGRLGDRRFHASTAELLALVALGRYTLFRDPARARAQALAVRDRFRELWSRGLVVVAPVTAFPPPRLLRSNRESHLLSCTVGGNLADATALAIPFGTFDGRLPRAVQLMGPPGSEDVLLELGQRLVELRDRTPSLRQPRVELG